MALREFAGRMFLLAFLSLPALSAQATLQSTNFIQLGGHVSSIGASRVSSSAPNPVYLGSGVTVGEGFPVALFGSNTSLDTVSPGFWGIVAGGLPSIDLDGDGVQAFLDDDNDNDGLDDLVETGTGFFVGPGDTGTSPNVFDTDGDGVGDGQEVLLGSDPNNPNSLPGAPVSSLGPKTLAYLLVVLLSMSAFIPRRQRERGIS